MGNRRLKARVCVLCLAWAGCALTGLAAWAAAPTPVPSANGCGAGSPQFLVVTDSAVPGAPPKVSRSRIVIFQPGDSVTGGTQVFRVAVDGVWTAALRDYSWQAFLVAPGRHHVCVQWESPLKSLAQETATAMVQARPGQTSWLELSVSGSPGAVSSFYLFGVSPGEGRVVAVSLPHAISTPRK